MFSNSVELILSIAYREATARRHTHLTLEHLLYVLAHDAEGEKILNACGADLPALRSELEQVPVGEGRAVPARAPAGARADAGVPPHAADRRAARAERQPARGAGRRPAGGDAAAAQVVRLAAARRPGRHAPRHPELHQPRHLEGAADLDGSLVLGVVERRRRAVRPGRGRQGLGPRSAGRLHRQPVGRAPRPASSIR